MRRIVVYEYLSGGGPVGSDAEAAALLPSGVAMRNALAADLLRLPGVAVTCAVCERPGAAVPPAWPGAALSTVAARHGETAAAFVRRAAIGHDLAWVVAPETGGVLAQLHEAVGAARWIGSDVRAIRLSSSKRGTLAALAAAGIDTPLALEPGHAGRWVVKPDDGAGTVDTRVHPDREAAAADLRRREQAGQAATMEPFIEGEALSVSVLVGRGKTAGAVDARAAADEDEDEDAGEDAARVVAFNRQRIEAGPDGVLVDRGVQAGAIDLRRDPRADRLHALTLNVIRALPGLRGFVGIDLVWHAERGALVIEVNPRVTCAYVGLSRSSGSNLAGEILALHGLPEASRG